MKRKYVLTLGLVFALGGLSHAQQATNTPDFGQASQVTNQSLADSLAELSRLREAIAEKQIPLSKALAEWEIELVSIRENYKAIQRTLDRRALGLSNLNTEVKTLENEVDYVASLMADYVREMESRLHIVELARYEEDVNKAKLAAENPGLSPKAVFDAQLHIVDRSIERLEGCLGGVNFEGDAVNAAGLVKQGTFLLLGPAAIFHSTNGAHVGIAEQKLGSLKPTLMAFGNPEDEAAARGLIQEGSGLFPLDPTLGNAQKIEATHESFMEHVQKGGPVMIPIFAMAGIALLIALFKWFSFILIGKPSKKNLRKLQEAVGKGDVPAAEAAAQNVRGPVGRMLAIGVDHISEPRELVEEVMYESMLTTRLKLQSFLPFIAICAASAPLLGLLGTVSGIINTFKMITVFGSGDVKSLSGGISEALITTKFGLIVAIPSLLIHAFLARRAKSLVGQMESSAVAMMNQVSKAEANGKSMRSTAAPVMGSQLDPALVRGQVQEILKDMLGDNAEAALAAGATGSANGEAAQA